MIQGANKPERRLDALAVSRGIGVGRVQFLQDVSEHTQRVELTSSQIETEIQRFGTALRNCSAQLKSLAADAQTESDVPVSSIFGIHLLILEEPAFIEAVESHIRREKVNAEWAVSEAASRFIAKQKAVDDPRFREKSVDIEDVSFRLLSHLNGSSLTTPAVIQGAVVVARRFSPSSIVDLRKRRPAALISEKGGWTSHSSILAREFELPMISGIGNLSEILSHGDQVAVDAVEGQLIIEPSIETLEHLRANTSSISERGRADLDHVGPVTMIDDTPIIIRANVDIPDSNDLKKLGAVQGVGLFRSESLISRSGSLPSEEDQLREYLRVAKAAGDGGVNIRTFDVGIDLLRGHALMQEMNPSLGLRSIRLSLTQEQYFRTQIRAILRAAEAYNIGIILPMISGVNEVVRSTAIINEERSLLATKQIPSGDVRIGTMIEVPSAVLTVREIAKHVDFLCLGTNDLVQYLLAVDRDNEAVAEWYQTLHPAVIRSLRLIFISAKAAGKPVIACGEMAGSAFYVPILIGLGARELSMNIHFTPQIRELISCLSLSKCKELVRRIQVKSTAEEIEASVREFYHATWPELFPKKTLNDKHL